MCSIEERLNTILMDREQNGILRQLTVRSPLIDFASNDYFGRAAALESRETFKQELANSDDFCLGATGSRLITGNSEFVEQVEDQIAHFHQVEAALIFSSGYAANVGFIEAIAKRGDVILRDECIHASMIDGCRLSFASSFHFKHNDLTDLETKLKRYCKSNCFVLVESLYSMEGDFAPLTEISELCNQYHATLIVDEAHALGVLDGGLVQTLNLHHRVFARIVTFGKALGIQGAAILGSKTLINYLTNYCRSFIFSTGISPLLLHAIKLGYRFLANSEKEAQVLQEKCRLFIGLPTKEKTKVLMSPIQIFILPGNELVDKASNLLRLKGFDVRPIKSPTVKKGRERLRICLHTFNTDADISRLLYYLRQIKQTFNECTNPCL